MFFLFTAFAFADENEENTERKGKLESLEKSKKSDDTESDFPILLALELIRIAPDLLIEFRNENEFLYQGTYWSRGFTEYPFQNEINGNFSAYSEKSTQLNTSISYLASSGNLSAMKFETKFSPISAMNIDFEYSKFDESIGFNKRAALEIFNIGANYNRIRFEDWNIWWGAGLTVMNGKDTQTAFLTNIGLEVFAFEPLSINCEYKLSTFVDNLHNFKTKANIHIDRFYVGGGYEFYSKGDTFIDGVLINLGIYL